MEAMGTTPADYAHIVVHQPNVKFPVRAMKTLGFQQEQWRAGLLVGEIGNTYAGSSIVGLTAVLDVAEPGQQILVVSYGSGAGSDAFHLRVTDRITEIQKRAPQTWDYIRRRVVIDYAQYARMRGKLATN
jgi:hydroxymethylglutaryl-CoA synthase